MLPLSPRAEGGLLCPGRVGVTHHTSLGTHRRYGTHTRWHRSEPWEGQSSSLAFLVEAGPGCCVFGEDLIRGPGGVMEKEPSFPGKSERGNSRWGRECTPCISDEGENNSTPLTDAAGRKQLPKEKRAMWGPRGTALLWRLEGVS